jgi:streptomycin 6-kinase
VFDPERRETTVPVPAVGDLAATDFAAARSPEGKAWIAGLPSLLAGLARQWNLTTTGEEHYGNILANQGAGERWVAIDPTAAVGAPERSTAELLWTRVDELPSPHAITSLLRTVVDNGQLDPGKAIAWSFVRSLDYWLWGLQNGLTIDPLRCQRVASALAPMAGQSNLLNKRK